VTTMSEPTDAENCTPPDDDERPGSSTPSAADDDAPKVSRRQLKRQARLESKLAHRKEKRQQEKVRRKEKNEQRIASGQPPLKRSRPGRGAKRMHESENKIRVAVDMSFEEFMNESGLRNTFTQLSHCYAVNRRAERPLQFHIVNLNGSAREIFNSIDGYKNWDVHNFEESLEDLWQKEEIVYLTSESENVLEQLDPEKLYVIGGLIDRNAHKGLTHSLAKEKGFQHARLPIDEHVSLKTRKVVTINQVFEILLRFTECNSWEEAFFAVMPKRKGMEKLEKGEDAGIAEPEDGKNQCAKIEKDDEAEPEPGGE